MRFIIVALALMAMFSTASAYTEVDITTDVLLSTGQDEEWIANSGDGTITSVDYVYLCEKKTRGALLSSENYLTRYAIDVSGNSNKDDLARCVQYCDEHEECISFDYYQDKCDEGHVNCCRLHKTASESSSASKTGRYWCRIMSIAEESSGDPKDPSTSYDCQSGSNEGTGNSIYEFQAESKEECARMCNTNFDCNSFDYVDNNSDDACRLFEEHTDYDDSDNRAFCSIETEFVTRTCTCSDDGVQENTSAGDWCWITSPCYLLTGDFKEDWVWARCEWDGETQLDCSEASTAIEASVGSDITGDAAGGSGSPVGDNQVGDNQANPQNTFSMWNFGQGFVAAVIFVGFLALSNKLYRKYYNTNSYEQLAEVVEMN